MHPIENLQEVRRDGQIIDESMSRDDILRLGQPQKIVELCWTHDSRIHEFKFHYGVNARTVAGREYLVALEMLAEDSNQTALWVITADGQYRTRVQEPDKFRNHQVTGNYYYLTTPNIDQPNVFGVIFDDQLNNLQFQLDIDAENCRILAEYYIR